MKPVQLWLPDTQNPALREALDQMCLDIESYPGAEDDRAFIYALSQDDEVAQRIEQKTYRLQTPPPHRTT
jgi:hypothetical protein